MRLFSNDHLSLDALSDFRRLSAADRGAPAHEHVVRHLQSCNVCRESLGAITQLEHDVAQLRTPTASLALRDRMLASRAAGHRVILPVTAAEYEARPRGTRKTQWRAWAAAAAALAIATIGLSMGGASLIEAAATAGTLVLSNDAPRAGERVTLRYRAGSTLGRQAVLVLRARVRTARADAYAPGVPVVTLATLQKQRDGVFTGSFTLADSIVFGALAVEDPGATEIDDHGGRTWTVLRTGQDGKRTLASLLQLSNDLFGRNWEEIFTTAASMVALYPDSLEAWSWLKSAHGWMGMTDDSVRSLHRGHVAKFDAQLRAQASPSVNDLARLARYAKGVEPVLSDHWKTRVLNEAPLSEFAISTRRSAALRILWDRADTLGALGEMDAVWAHADGNTRRDITSYFTEVAFATKDTAIMRRWADRQLAVGVGGSSRGSEAWLRRWVALEFAMVPSLRAEGLVRLRAELTRLSAASRTVLGDTTGTAVDGRSLDETVNQYQERIDSDTRAAFAFMGRALVLAGQPRAALDTLALAAATGWNVSVIRDIRLASLAAGDTAIALTMTARLAVDPRVTAERADSLAAFALKLTGKAAWAANVNQQRQEYVKRVLSTSAPRSLGGSMRIRGTDDVQIDLRQLTKGQVTIVAFWSRFCGPAIMSLPELHKVATRLGETGVRTLMVIEESTWSPELRAFLKENDVTIPVYLDDKHEASSAFNQWSTPNYFVLDADGRILFEATGDTDLLLVRAEAARLAATLR